MTSLSIQSNENLEITVTKAGLTLLTDLGQVRALKVSFFEIIFFTWRVLSYAIFYQLGNGPW